MTRMVFPFTTSAPITVQEVGGKALALITLTRQGLPVPPGFVLAVGFFEPWQAALARLPAWEAAHNSSGQALREDTRTLQSACRQLEFDAQQRAQLRQALNELQASAQLPLFAVRSSAPEEDLENASFAGGYETTLGVPPDEIEDAIRHSFASSLDERVFLYKRVRGLNTHQARIAVIVQQQVDASSAGVAFSLNPLNNCYDEALINANHGLGESVVAGEVEPDVYVVDRPAGRILTAKSGGGGIVKRLNPNGGTTQAQRSLQDAASLVPEQVLQIAALLDQVEALYLQPVDIEWAIAGDRLSLLQARPITTYLPLPDEMLTAPGAPKRLYADATLLEQGVQEPLSVLGTDFMNDILKQMTSQFGANVLGLDGIIFTAGGRYYMHLSHSRKMLGANAPLVPGSIGDASLTAILDNLDMAPYLQEALPARLKKVRSQMLFSMLPMAARALRTYWQPEARLRAYTQALPAHLARFEHVASLSLSIQQLAVALTGLLDFFYVGYGIPFILASQFAQRQIQRLFARDAAQAGEHLSSLGIAMPGNKTAEMGERMAALAASPELARHATTEAFLRALADRTLDADFLQEWDTFVQEFGARCPRELDVATPRPNEQPGQLFEQLKQMAPAAPGSGQPASLFAQARARRAAAYQALHELALKKGRRQARALEQYYRVWLALGGMRETPKHYIIRVVDAFRKRVLQVAQSLVAAGRLDDPNQIFDLTKADIDQALHDPALDLRRLAQERSAFIRRVRRSRLAPPVIDSRGKMFYPPRQSIEDGALTGISISPGLARGRVKVLHHVHEKPLLPGEILVARATDPGWTPLFINASGIILEIGGALQHGAVVAREYGIPCISGLEGATEMLKDGQLVEVDGSNGVVRVIDEERETRRE